MSHRIQLDNDALATFCRKWRVRELSIFGSALRDDFSPDSDLDFLVSFEPGTSLNISDLLDMKEELEARYERPVDLIEKEALRNPWRKREILRTREVIYAASAPYPLCEGDAQAWVNRVREESDLSREIQVSHRV